MGPCLLLRVRIPFRCTDYERFHGYVFGQGFLGGREIGPQATGLAIISQKPGLLFNEASQAEDEES